eukprot:903080-Amphidinium_carterae.1
MPKLVKLLGAVTGLPKPLANLIRQLLCLNAKEQQRANKVKACVLGDITVGVEPLQTNPGKPFSRRWRT